MIARLISSRGSYSVGVSSLLSCCSLISELILQGLDHLRERFFIFSKTFNLQFHISYLFILFRISNWPSWCSRLFSFRLIIQFLLQLFNILFQSSYLSTVVLLLIEIYLLILQFLLQLFNGLFKCSYLCTVVLLFIKIFLHLSNLSIENIN